MAETVAEAGALTRAGGRVVVLGVLPKGERVPIEPFDLLVREIQLHFSYINPFTQTRAADLIASGRIAVEPLISRSIPLAEAVEAIGNPARPGEVKVVVVPGHETVRCAPNTRHFRLVPPAAERPPASGERGSWCDKVREGARCAPARAGKCRVKYISKYFSK